MTTTDTFQKEIRYDRETRDFCATLDGNCIGYFASRHEAEVALDQVAYDLLMAGQTRTAIELDGGSDADAVAEAVAPEFVCAACETSEYSPSSMQPAFCFECVHAMLKGRSNRLEVAAAVVVPDQLPVGWVRMPEGDILDADGMRVQLPSSPCSDCQGVPAEMTSDTAQTILDALNEAQRLQYTTSELQAHTTYEGVIASLRAELDAYGYTTKLSGRTGAWVPASAHGWRYVSGVRAHYTAPAITQVNWSDRQHCRTCGSDKHPTSACPITTPPARQSCARLVGDLGF